MMPIRIAMKARGGGECHMAYFVNMKTFLFQPPTPRASCVLYSYYAHLYDDAIIEQIKVTLKYVENSVPIALRLK